MDIQHTGQSSVLEYLYEKGDTRKLKDWHESYKADTDYEGSYAGFRKFCGKLHDKGLLEKPEGRGYYCISDEGTRVVRRRRGEGDEDPVSNRPEDHHDTFHRFKNLFRDHFEDEIIQDTHDGGSFEFSLRKLMRADTQLADKLLEQPQDTIPALEEAYESLSLWDVEPGEPSYIFTDIPQHIVTSIIKAKTSSHVSAMVGVEGMVAEISAIHPEIVSATFECSNCGDRFEKEQDSSKLKSPYKCECGNRNFELVERDFEDVLELVLQEESDQAISRAESMRCYIRGRRVSPDLRRRFEPGQTAKVIGVPRTQPMKKDDTKQEVVMEVYGIETSSISWDSIEVEDEERDRLKQADREDVYRSIAPHLVGEDADMMRKAAVFSVIGAPDRYKNNGRTKFRGNIHSLLVSPPSEGKTDILRDVKDMFPRAKYSDCTNSTAIGLIASLEQEEDNRWRVIAKTMVKANGGVACLDEFDAMEKDSTEKLNEALENQETHLAKASIEVTLPCDTNVLAAANPIHGDFNDHEPIVAQLPDAAASTLSRFDIQIVSHGVESQEDDVDVAYSMLDSSTEGGDRLLSKEDLRKYVYLAKQVEPELSKKAAETIAGFYADIRQAARENDDVSASSSKPRARIVRSIQNVATCLARMDFSDTVTDDHAEDAVEFFKDMFAMKNLNLEQGEFGVDSMGGGKRAMERRIKQEIMELLRDINDAVYEEDVIDDVEGPEETIEDMMEKLEDKGDLYRPEPDKVKAL